MQTRKSKKANLEDKKGLFLELGFVIALSLVLIAFEWTSQPKELVDMGNVEDEEFVPEIVPLTEREELQPPPPEPVIQEKFEIVDDTEEPENELFIPDVGASEETKLAFDLYDPPKEKAEDDKVFIKVEDMPQFRGGDLAKFRKYVMSRLKYPPAAAQNGIEGKVTIHFIVDENGNVTNVEVYASVHPALDQEALRVVKDSPQWTPGKQRGKAVKVAYYLPVSFVLQ